MCTLKQAPQKLRMQTNLSQVNNSTSTLFFVCCWFAVLLMVIGLGWLGSSSSSTFTSRIVSRYCTYCQYQRSGATKGARDVVIRIGGQEFLAFSRRRFLSGVECPQLGYSLIPARTGVLRGSHHHRFMYIYVYICGGSDWGLNVSSLSS